MQVNELVKKMLNRKLDNLHVAIPARINKYDPQKMRAEITLLVKNRDGEVIPPILEVPVKHEKFGPFILRPGYKKGDVVQVLFNERALDKLLITGKPEDTVFRRRFSYDDAVIIGGLKIEQENKYPAEEPESFYVCNLEKKVKLYLNPDGTFRIANDQDDIQVEIVMQEDGIIRITDNKNGTELRFDINNTGNVIFNLANKLFLGSAGATEGVPLGDSLKSWLDNHTHPGDSGGTTGPPDTPSPSPSAKVMVE